MEIATVLFAQKKFSKEILNFEICYRCDLLVIQGVIVLVISNRCRSSLLAIDRPILKCPARLLPEFYSSCILSIILKNIATVNISFWLVCRGRFNLCQIVSIAEQINFYHIGRICVNWVCSRWYLLPFVAPLRKEKLFYDEINSDQKIKKFLNNLAVCQFITNHTVTTFQPKPTKQMFGQWMANGNSTSKQWNGYNVLLLLGTGSAR